MEARPKSKEIKQTPSKKTILKKKQTTTTSKTIPSKPIKKVIKKKTLPAKSKKNDNSEIKSEKKKLVTKKKKRIVKKKPVTNTTKAPKVKGIVHIKNLRINVDKNQLTSLFKKFGKIEKLEILINHQNKLPKGSAVLQFEDKSQAELAIQKLNGTQFKGREIEVIMLRNDGSETESGYNEPINAQRKESMDIEEMIEQASDLSTTVFIRNFDQNSTEEQLQKQFSNFGAVEYAKLIKKISNKELHKGVGFVKFVETSSAEKVIHISRRISKEKQPPQILDAECWLEFNSKRVTVTAAKKRKDALKKPVVKNDSVKSEIQVEDVKKTEPVQNNMSNGPTCSQIIESDKNNTRFLKFAKFGLPVFEEDNFNTNTKTEQLEDVEKNSNNERSNAEKKWREAHLQYKLAKMRNSFYKVNLKKILMKGISKALDQNALRLHILSVLSKEDYTFKLQTKNPSIATIKKLKTDANQTNKKSIMSQLRKMKIFKHIKLIKDPLFNNQLKGEAVIQFRDELSAEVYMKGISDPDNYKTLLNTNQNRLPIIEYMLIDSRTVKSVKADSSQKTVMDNKVVNTSANKADQTVSKVIIVNPKDAEATAECFLKMDVAIKEKNLEKAIEVISLVNKLKSRGKRQRFFKKLKRSFDSKKLFGKKEIKKFKVGKTKKIVKKKKASDNQNGVSGEGSELCS